MDAPMRGSVLTACAMTPRTVGSSVVEPRRELRARRRREDRDDEHRQKHRARQRHRQ
jgi:hypothetical protein